jgi:hypothetical protein
VAPPHKSAKKLPNDQKGIASGTAPSPHQSTIPAKGEAEQHPLKCGDSEVVGCEQMLLDSLNIEDAIYLVTYIN